MLALCSLAAVLVVGTVTCSNSTTACPDKWVDASHVGMGCLFYDWEEGRVASSYLSAVTSCTQGPYGEFCPICGTGTGHLVEILTLEQHQYIKNTLNMMENGNTKQFYTAATDMNSEGVWYWSHSRLDVEEFVWQAGWPQYQQYSMYGTLHKPCPDTCPEYEWTLRDVPEYWNGGSGFYPFCQVINSHMIWSNFLNYFSTTHRSYHGHLA